MKAGLMGQMGGLSWQEALVRGSFGEGGGVYSSRIDRG